MNDGVYRFSDENARMAVIKEGESYYIVDYETRHISNPLAVSDVNRVLKQVRDGASARTAAESVASVTPMQESAPVEASAPAERLALKKDAEGNTYVQVDNVRVNATHSPEQIVPILADVVRTKFTDFVQVNGQKIGLSKK